jgi:hypothetical protein
VTTGLVLILSLTMPVVVLAEWTSRIILLVFTVVCLALLRLKLKKVPVPTGVFQVNPVVPAAGSLLCAALLAADLIWG